MLQETSRLVAFWRTKRDGRDMPDRANFRAEEFGPWMGSIVICSVEQPPLRFRLRLIGTAVRDLDDREYTGWYLDEALDEPLRGHIVGQWALCVAERRPVLVNHASSPALHAQLDMEKLFLPMSTGSDAVGQVLAYFRVRREGRTAARWPTLQELEHDGSSSVTVID